MRLVAHHPDGVPLHPAEHDRHLSGRLSDGARVEVMRWGEGRRWLEVRAPDGRRGWITARYLAAAGERSPPTPGSRSPFASPDACRTHAAERSRRREGEARVASWNLRWFPDGSSEGPSESPTDVAWVACALASMNVDAVALQEIMLHPRGRAAMARLTARLSELTGGRWQSRFDECPRDGRQHVGWLWDASRVTLVSAEQVDSLNPTGGCSYHLRPGLAAYFRFHGGLDLHAVVVHLDSGVEGHDHRHRRESIAALEGALDRLRSARPDEDVLVLGDFNTMGCRSCPGRVRAEEERAQLDAQVAGFASPLSRVAPAVACTEYYRSRGSLLDLVLASRSMRELPSGAHVRVEGPCAR